MPSSTDHYGFNNDWFTIRIAIAFAAGLCPYVIVKLWKRFAIKNTATQECTVIKESSCTGQPEHPSRVSVGPDADSLLDVGHKSTDHVADPVTHTATKQIAMIERVITVCNQETQTTCPQLHIDGDATCSNNNQPCNECVSLKEDIKILKQAHDKLLGDNDTLRLHIEKMVETEQSLDDYDSEPIDAELPIDGGVHVCDTSIGTHNRELPTLAGPSLDLHDIDMTLRKDGMADLHMPHHDDQELEQTTADETTSYANVNTNVMPTISCTLDELDSSSSSGSDVLFEGDSLSDDDDSSEGVGSDDDDVMTDDMCHPGPAIIGDNADFELGSDIMEAILSGNSGGLMTILGRAKSIEDGPCNIISANQHEDVMTDNLSQDSLEGEDADDMAEPRDAISEESIGDIQNTKRFWENLAADHAQDDDLRINDHGLIESELDNSYRANTTTGT